MSISFPDGNSEMPSPSATSGCSRWASESSSSATAAAEGTTRSVVISLAASVVVGVPAVAMVEVVVVAVSFVAVLVGSDTGAALGAAGSGVAATATRRFFLDGFLGLSELAAAAYEEDEEDEDEGFLRVPPPTGTLRRVPPLQNLVSLDSHRGHGSPSTASATAAGGTV
nr:unnamed protein product [Digitaria exilis]